MAITNDSGVRTTGAFDLTQLGEEDRELAASREQAATKGLRGMDVPLNNPDADHDEPHVAPLWIMYGTFAALLMLTAATVGVRQIDLGATLNIVVALSLAFIKALLVAFFFMHLFWDSKFNQLMLVSTLLFLTIFIGMAIIDTNQYEPITQPHNQNAYAGDIPT